MPVIANTTIISNFASVRQLELLRLLWEKIYLSDQVFNEIQAGFMQGYEFYAGIEQLISCRTVDNIYITKFTSQIDSPLSVKSPTTLSVKIPTDDAC